MLAELEAIKSQHQGQVQNNNEIEIIQPNLRELEREIVLSPMPPTNLPIEIQEETIQSEKLIFYFYLIFNSNSNKTFFERRLRMRSNRENQ